MHGNIKTSLLGSRLFDMMEFSQDQYSDGHYTIDVVDCIMCLEVFMRGKSTVKLSLEGVPKQV
jgi:hypothetical protein